MEGTANTAVGRWLPGFLQVKSYQRKWLTEDLVAGLVLSALLVPQGMAYAELAGLPPVTGLYTSMLCLLGYAVFGPSRILVLGPDSALGPMIAATILPLVGANGNPARAIALASLLAIFAGAIIAIGGIAKLGFIADLLSKPSILGYMNGLALTILVGQLPKLLGFSIDVHGFIGQAREVVAGVIDGEVVAAAAAVGMGSLALILILKRYVRKLPALLVVVVAATVVATVFGLGARGVHLVGPLPPGLPSLTIPSVAWADVLPVFAGALGIVLVTLTDTISTSASFAERRDEEVDASQEMFGIGVANLAAGLFQGFPVSTSGSRTAVAEQSGAKTQLTGVVGAVVIALMLVALPGLLRNLPQSALAAIVIAASISLADIPATRRLWSQSRADFLISIAAFLGVVLLGVLTGIAVAVGISVANVFRRTWWPHQATLGRVSGLRGFHDIRRHPDAEQLAGCVMYRFDAPLIFANARTFRDQVRKCASTEPRPRWIIVEAEPITDIDTTACGMLEDLVTVLDKQGTKLVFAEMKTHSRHKMLQYGLGKLFPDDRFFPTLRAAVSACREELGERWVGLREEEQE
jgi:high affinity sulfate transporter 1